MGLLSTPAGEKIEIHLPDYGPPNFGPSDRQVKFHSSKAFETFFGGAAGPGKSTALCADAISFCIKYPGHRAFFFRRTTVMLRQGTLPVLSKQIAAYMSLPDHLKSTMPNGKPLTIKWRQQDKVFAFSNGSFIQFAYLQNEADLGAYSSIEMHWLGMDEVTQFKEEEYMFLLTRVRADTDRPLRVRCASNPGDIGHNWVRERFIESVDPTIHYIPEVPYEQEYEDPVTSEKYVRTRVFIPAFVTDNPNQHIQVEYRRNLNAIKDPQLRKALLYGDWNSFKDQVYTEFDKNLHMIEGKLPVDLDTCEKFIGFDWGYRDPAVAVWIALAPENEQGIRHYYAYREIHMTSKSPKWWAQTIKGIIDDEEIQYMVLPHDCFSHVQSSTTIADTFRAAGVPFVRADSLSHAAKMHRIALLHDLMSLADDGQPYLQIHRNCANTLATVPTLPYSKTRPEEIDDKADDHDFDALTYGLMVVDDPEGYIVNDQSEPNQDRYNSNNLARAISDSAVRFNTRSSAGAVIG